MSAEHNLMPSQVMSPHECKHVEWVEQANTKGKGLQLQIKTTCIQNDQSDYRCWSKDYRYRTLSLSLSLSLSLV